MEIYRKVKDKTYKIELTEEEIKKAAKIMEKEKEKTLADAVSALGQGQILTAYFHKEEHVDE